MGPTGTDVADLEYVNRVRVLELANDRLVAACERQRVLLDRLTEVIRKHAHELPADFIEELAGMVL